MAKKNNNDELFEEARNESLNDAVKQKMQAKISNLPAETKNDLLEKIKERVEEGETQWDLLKKMIDGSMTERFIKVMNEMPDKDFARTYLKLLEHFKPKITRAEMGTTNEPDNKITIETIIVNQVTGEKEIINIEDIDHEEID